MPEESFLTRNGEKRFREELEHLKTTVRRQLSERLRFAIQQGDLSENADYHKAKEDQSFIEGRINELEHILKEVVIIEDLKRKPDIISIGSTITVLFDGEDDEETYWLVGPAEANPNEGLISFESPLGEALMHHRPGEHVEIVLPNGLKSVIKIIKIQ